MKDSNSTVSNKDWKRSLTSRSSARASRLAIALIIPLWGMGCLAQDVEPTLNTTDGTSGVLDPSQQGEDSLLADIQTEEDLAKYIADHGKTPAVLEGRLQVAIAEDSESGFHDEKYFVFEGDVPIDVSILGASANEAAGLVDEGVTLSGFEEEGTFFGLVTEHSETASTKGTIDPSTAERMLILLVDFNDSEPPVQYPNGRPVVEASTVAYHLNTGYYRDYEQQVFKNRIRTTASGVVDWQRQNGDCADFVLPGYPSAHGYLPPQQLIDIIQANNIDPTQYDVVGVISNCKTATGWGIASALSIGGHVLHTASVNPNEGMLFFGNNDEPVPGFGRMSDGTPSFLKNFVHERAHNSGIMHADGLDCGDSEVLFPCNHEKYGNVFDTMGRGYVALSLNADLLRRNGLRDPQNFMEVSTAGEYEVAPLLSTGAGAMLGIYIRSEFSNTPVFMLENRTATGVDNELSAPEFSNVVDGLLISTALGTSSDGSTSGVVSPEWGQYFRIIDPDTSNGTGWFPHRIKHDAITSTNTFFDPISGIEIAASAPLPSGNVRFTVEYDEQRRVCYKGNLPEQVRQMYLLRNNGGSDPGNDKTAEKVGEERATDDPIFRSGDRFDLNTGTRLSVSNPMMCPRDDVRIRVLNPGVLDGWAVNTSTGNFTFDMTSEDYDRSSHVEHFEVPAPELAPAGDYILDVEYTNLRTNETMQSRVVVTVETA